MVSQVLKQLPAAGLLLATLIGATAGAAQITVNSTGDPWAPGDAQCTLSAAIVSANADTSVGGCFAGSGADTINFSLPQPSTITLQSTLPNIISGSTITIDGAGQSVTVSGNHAVRVMFVDLEATLNLSRLTIANGFADVGGGIFNVGTLTVTDSTFSGNSAADDGDFVNAGGGIYNDGTLTVADSTFSGNSADAGGGIFNNSTLTVSVADSTFSGNSASDGGGIFNHETATVTDSTFSGNSAINDGGGGHIFVSGVGGGIFNNSTLTVTNNTFSGNSADVAGGGIFNGKGATLNLANTILANSISGADCVNTGGTLTSSGVNLVKDGSCGATLTGDPLLGSLADNGGPTLTHALCLAPRMPNASCTSGPSPAIDAADNTICANAPVNNLDQRGVTRPQDGNGDGIAVCDIGAFELEPTVDACTTAEVLDDFNRHDGHLGRHWRGNTATGFYRIQDQQLDVRLGGPAYWNPDRFDTDQAAFVTLSRVDTSKSAQGVLLKVQDGKGPHTGRKDHEDDWDRHDGKDHEDDASFGGAIAVAYDGKAKAVRVSTFLPRHWDWRSYRSTPVTFKDGDKLGGCARADGTVHIYKNDVRVTTVTLYRDDKKFFHDKGGKVGIWSQSADHAILDDFGGGTIKP